MDKLLILDLDDTLIHSSEWPLQHEADFRFAGYHVYFRPGARAFIDACHKLFTLAVWTTATREYATAILEQWVPLDRFTFIWCRENCSLVDDETTGMMMWQKELDQVSTLGWGLGDVLIVDDQPAFVATHADNLIPIAPFTGSPADSELALLADYLASLADVPDVRRIDKRDWRSRSAQGQ